MRYLALGDSYTIGEGVADAQRWPMQLIARLGQQGIAVNAPQIVATTGWTTDELSAAMDTAPLEPPYDLVSLLIGVNNQYRGRHAREYEHEFAGLLARALRLAGDRRGRTLVLSIPDWGVTAFGVRSGRNTAQIARELDDYNTIARKICVAEQVAFVDITPISRQYPAQVTADELHPSGEQYGLWVEWALPTVHAMLSS
ncbi:SGNH/GDSL hydrolase family protein [Dyella sp.]|uniref:SGNH/GDSL hydrolase family protein n=1 Tax=Dyella sp. TaxID=1869338 RepID=UPI002ED64F92